MYIETSFGSVGDRANLISPIFQKVDAIIMTIEGIFLTFSCLLFQYFQQSRNAVIGSGGK